MVVFFKKRIPNRSSAGETFFQRSISDFYIVDPSGKVGGHWLWWSKDINMIIIHSSHHCIGDEAAEGMDRTCWALLCIYTPISPSKRRLLWLDIHNFITASPGPVILMGDLNSMLKPQEKIGDIPVHQRQVYDIWNFMFQSGLMNMESQKYD